MYKYICVYICKKKHEYMYMYTYIYIYLHVYIHISSIPLDSEPQTRTTAVASRLSEFDMADQDDIAIGAAVT